MYNQKTNELGYSYAISKMLIQGNQVQLGKLRTYVHIVVVSSCRSLVQKRPVINGWASTYVY